MVRVGRYALIALLTVAYYVIIYHASVSAEQRWLSVSLALLPLAGFALFAAWSSRRRYVMVGAVLLAAGAFWLVLSDLIVRNYMWFYLLQHAGINGGLAVFFGRTLLGQRTPLITRFAAIVHDGMPPGQTRYTRQVTVAWTLFFLTIAMLSIVLFLFAPIEVWSLFANILYLPLLILMFAVEYLVRLRRLPHIKHVSLADTLRISSRYYREKYENER